MSNTIEMTLNPETGKYEAKFVPDPDPAPANLERSGGALAGVVDFEFQGLQIGKVAVGAVGAGVGDILVHLVEPFTRQLPVVGSGLGERFRKALLLGGAAWVARTGFARNIMGDEGAEMASNFLLFDAVGTVWNGRTFVGEIAHKVGFGSHAGRGLRREFNVPRRSLPGPGQNNPVASAATSRAALVGV